jgi:hypothetical protein
MFADIRAKTDWNLDEDMLWGYFFTNAKRRPLERAAKQLEQAGYRFVDLFQPEGEGKPLGYYFLHVEKVETHSVKSLYRRNTELTAFALKCGLDSYDGMDVGAASEPEEN